MGMMLFYVLKCHRDTKFCRKNFLKGYSRVVECAARKIRSQHHYSATTRGKTTTQRCYISDAMQRLRKYRLATAGKMRATHRPISRYLSSESYLWYVALASSSAVQLKNSMLCRSATLLRQYGGVGPFFVSISPLSWHSASTARQGFRWKLFSSSVL